MTWNDLQNKLDINMLEESNSKVKTTLVQLYFNNYLNQLELIYVTSKTYMKIKKKKEREGKKKIYFNVCLIV